MYVGLWIVRMQKPDASERRHMRIYGDNLMEIIELKAKLELIESALRGDA